MRSIPTVRVLDSGFDHCVEPLSLAFSGKLDKIKLSDKHADLLSIPRRDVLFQFADKLAQVPIETIAPVTNKLLTGHTKNTVTNPEPTSVGFLQERSAHIPELPPVRANPSIRAHSRSGIPEKKY